MISISQNINSTLPRFYDFYQVLVAKDLSMLHTLQYEKKKQMIRFFTVTYLYLGQAVW